MNQSASDKGDTHGLTPGQMEAVAKIQQEMACSVAGSWRVIISGDIDEDTTIDLEVLVRADFMTGCDVWLEQWSQMVPGYQLDDPGHGQERDDGLLWRGFHLVPSPETN